MGKIGNQYGTKLKGKELRQEAYRQYCDHIASGMPKQAFFFDHPTASVCWKTMDRYIKENPKEFPSLLMEKAKARRYAHWLEEGKSLMKGLYKCGSPVVWQTIMRNIFKDIGWEDKDSRPQESPELREQFCALMSQLATHQTRT